MRERTEDIEKLVTHFLSVQSKSKSKSFSISMKSLAAMVSYEWPGNVRELANFIQRVSVLASGSIIRFKDIPEQFLPSRIAQLYSENGLNEEEQAEVILLESQQLDHEKCGESFDYEQIIGL